MNLALGHAPPHLQALAREWPLVFMLDLPDDANIVVAGCYDGKVMDLLGWVYPYFGRMVGFDLQIEKVELARRKFSLDSRIEVHGYGLGGIRSGHLIVSRYGTQDANLMQGEATNTKVCKVKPAGLVFQDLKLDKIDLLLLNMEGYEYELLDYLIRHDWMHEIIKRVAVQFHPQYEPPRMFHLNDMIPTHHKVVDLFPQWVYWQLRNA